jgi:hypothetical protein
MQYGEYRVLTYRQNVYVIDEVTTVPASNKHHLAQVLGIDRRVIVSRSWHSASDVRFVPNRSICVTRVI